MISRDDFPDPSSAATEPLSLQLGAGATAMAQSVCMTHAEVEKQLGANYAEIPVALGLASENGRAKIDHGSGGDVPSAGGVKLSHL